MNLKPAYQAPKAQHIVNQCFTNQNQKALANDKARSNLEADLNQPGSSRFGQRCSPVDREFKRSLSCRSTEPQILLNRAYRPPNVRTGSIQNMQRHIHSTFRGYFDRPRSIDGSLISRADVKKGARELLPCYRTASRDYCPICTGTTKHQTATSLLCEDCLLLGYKTSGSPKRGIEFKGRSDKGMASYTLDGTLSLSLYTPAGRMHPAGNRPADRPWSTVHTMSKADQPWNHMGTFKNKVAWNDTMSRTKSI